MRIGFQAVRRKRARRHRSTNQEGLLHSLRRPKGSPSSATFADCLRQSPRRAVRPQAARTRDLDRGLVQTPPTPVSVVVVVVVVVAAAAVARSSRRLILPQSAALRVRLTAAMLRALSMGPT